MNQSRMLTQLAWAMVAIIYLVSPAVAQPQLAQEPKVYFRINLHGQLESQTISVSRLSKDLREASVLSCATVRQELELLDEQNAELSRILDAYEGDLAVLKKELTQRHMQRLEHGSVTEKLDALQGDTLQRVKDTLLPFQYRRLSQILNRCQLRRHGLKHALIGNQPLSSELAVRPEQRAQIVSAARKLGHQLNRDSLEYRIETIDRLLAELTNSQRELLKQQMGNYYYGPEGNLEVLIWQLSFTPEKQRLDGFDPFVGLRATAGFEIAEDGILRPLHAPSKRPPKPLVDLVLPLLNEDVMVQALEIDDVQTVMLKELAKYRRSSLKKLDWELQSAFERGELVSLEARTRLVRSIGQRQQRLWQSLDEDLHNILTPRQFEKLKAISAQLDVVRRGPLAALVSGKMGVELGVTDEQKKRLLETAAELRQELVRESAKVQEEVYTGLFETLDPMQRELLDQRLGKPLAKTQGNITLLILDLLPVMPKRR